MNYSQQQRQSGALLVLVLVFGSIFLVLVSGFIGSLISQSQAVAVRFEQQRATEIAEAGLNYYKWYLSHFPDDLAGDGTVTVFTDPEDGPIGEYELQVTSTEYCGQVTAIDVESTGYTYAMPNVQAVISATYKQPTVAEYSFVNNRAVWFGDSRVITGPVHGNQGLKMDGAHNAAVGSGQATFECTSSFGCTPTIPDADGVYTTSGLATPGLFEFPVDPIDFGGLTVDLSVMRTRAQAEGIYYGPASGEGYRADFQSDGTVNVYRVDNASTYWSFSSTEGWHDDERNHITSETFLATETIDPQCPVLFFEDKLWVEGQIEQKVTAAAGLNSANSQNNIVISDNLTYVSGRDAGFLAIAEDDIDIGLHVPNDLTANGIYIAQNGRFGRNAYCASCGDWIPTGPWWFWQSYGLPSALDQYVSRDSLTRVGSVVSNLRSGTEWSSGGVHTSGFRSRITSFDRNLIDNPPPLTPTTNDVYELQDWRQEG